MEDIAALVEAQRQAGQAGVVEATLDLAFFAIHCLSLGLLFSQEDDQHRSLARVRRLFHLLFETPNIQTVYVLRRALCQCRLLILELEGHKRTVLLLEAVVQISAD